MININNKPWDKLRLKDIEKFLKDTEDDERFFLEFKQEDITNSKLSKEISAFANSFGGYVLLGVDDSKNIIGCTNKWSELKINNVICSGVFPTPQFDIKKFNLTNSNKLFVIKIEEGTNPPYITNTGHIYHRVSSSSERVKDANTLNNLYLKNQNNIKNVENKIYIPELLSNVPNNLCGYVDFGFSLLTKNTKKTEEKIKNADIKKIVEKLKIYNSNYSISRVGKSLSITLGVPTMKIGGKTILTTGGICNFMEILSDGSFRCRAIICSELEDSVANIISISYIYTLFKKIYEIVFGKGYALNFIEAKKYEKLTTLKIFQPKIIGTGEPKYIDKFNKFFSNHCMQYGNNIICNNSRNPLNGFITIDKSLFNRNKLKFSDENLYGVLFHTSYNLLGYIDDFSIDPEED